MFSHVTVGCRDFAQSVVFYDAVLGVLGLTQSLNKPEQGWVGYTTAGTRGPMFLVGKPLDGKAPQPGNGVTIAFSAETRAQVDRFHETVLRAGGIDEGAPGLRAHYHPHYYAAYVRDPDGNKLCCVCHLPA